jgi:hypothetical protein
VPVGVKPEEKKETSAEVVGEQEDNEEEELDYEKL